MKCRNPLSLRLHDILQEFGLALTFARNRFGFVDGTSNVALNEVDGNGQGR